MQTLNVIGCGNVGKTLCRLWRDREIFQIGCVLNRSIDGARRAVEFVGAGKPIEDYTRLEPADVVMISTPDESIETCCQKLSETDALGRGQVVFHCSGSLDSRLLESAVAHKAEVASIHPVKSFADPARSVESFEGTFVALEGNPAPCQRLADALVGIGARTFPIQAEFKPIYHAATVMASNYLVALAESGLRCLEKSGVDRPTAMEVLGPLMTGTIQNVLDLGPTDALTGPIARGESSVVAREHDALTAWEPTLADIYRSLGQVAIELAEAQGQASPDALTAIRERLSPRVPIVSDRGG